MPRTYRNYLAKRSRPLLLGEQLDKQVRDYISYLRAQVCIINTHVVIAVGKGIVMGKNSNLLDAVVAVWSLQKIGQEIS